MNKEEVREYIFQAVQAGKKETSGLVGSVMGHIKNIEDHLHKQDTTLKEIKIEQNRVMVELSRLKKDTEPLVDGKKAITTLGKFIVWISVIVGSILTVLKLIK